MDGVITNTAAANTLGAVMDTHDLRYRPYCPYGPHPVTGDKVFVFIDPSHDIKNVRNAIGTTHNEKTDFDNPSTYLWIWVSPASIIRTPTRERDRGNGY